MTYGVGGTRRRAGDPLILANVDGAAETAALAGLRRWQPDLEMLPR